LITLSLFAIGAIAAVTLAVVAVATAPLWTPAVASVVTDIVNTTVDFVADVVENKIITVATIGKAILASMDTTIDNAEGYMEFIDRDLNATYATALAGSIAGAGSISGELRGNLAESRDANLENARSEAAALTLANTGNNRTTFIYRKGSGNATNLTPRERDTTGLSFSLTPPTDTSFTVTTMELINATGVLVAIKDGRDHVSVRPVDMAQMPVWIASRPNALNDPHEYTQILQNITFKVR